MDISRYWKALKPGHTYTYVFYAKKGDKEYRSKPGQFMTTGKKTINFETVNISNITDTGAKVEVWFSNDHIEVIPCRNRPERLRQRRRADKMPRCAKIE